MGPRGLCEYGNALRAVTMGAESQQCVANNKRAEFRRAERESEGMALKIRLERNSFPNVKYLNILLYCYHDFSNAFMLPVIFVLVQKH